MYIIYMSHTRHIGLKKFKKDLNFQCKKHGIKLKLINSATIPYIDNTNIQVSGYFDTMNMELAVAKGKDLVEWLEIIIHESCHLDQYVENCEVWNSNSYFDTDVSAIVDLWLSNIIELKPKILSEMINKIIDLERDCDLRAIEKIKKYKLDDIIDLKRYTQKSNAYHLSYIAVKKLRKWNKPNKAAYQVEEVLNSFSNIMSKKYTITDKQFKLLKKYCY